MSIFVRQILSLWWKYGFVCIVRIFESESSLLSCLFSNRCCNNPGFSADLKVRLFQNQYEKNKLTLTRRIEW